MRADRSEAGPRTASSARSDIARIDMAKKEGSRAGCGCGTRTRRRRQSPLCERGLSRAGGRPHRGQDRQGRRVDPRGRRLGDAGRRRRHEGSRGDRACSTRRWPTTPRARRPIFCVFNMGNNAAVDIREMTAQHFEEFVARRLLRRLPVRPRSGAPPGAARPRHGDLHRRLGLAARPAALCRLQRHQGRLAPAGPVAGARVRPAGHPYRPRHHRRRHRGRPPPLAHARPQGQGRRRRPAEHRGDRRQLLASPSPAPQRLDARDRSRPYKEPF